MALVETADGGQHDVLPLAELQLAAREDDEAVAEALGRGHRAQLVEVHPLENAGGSGDALFGEQVPVEGRMHHEPVVSARTLQCAPVEQGVFEGDDPDVAVAAEPLGEGTRYEAVAERMQDRAAVDAKRRSLERSAMAATCRWPSSRTFSLSRFSGRREDIIGFSRRSGGRPSATRWSAVWTPTNPQP
ncbi:hypothetical protein [Azospirillum isscasi]|uniref:Transposase n=1 Tax=Azospirillum isscasi TaxID=3053926 RepID=A0ABU0WC19_9PROT|nr:hypothetical protein [Azospirillum isscasi]MDQ2101733.1 hypothetical protein [Azospirillum isscasi]